jgi:hypothetical protein
MLRDDGGREGADQVGHVLAREPDGGQAAPLLPDAENHAVDLGVRRDPQDPARGVPADDVVADRGHRGHEHVSV